MKKSLLFIALATVTGSAFSAPYTFNARQDAMGGAGVTSANYLAMDVLEWSRHFRCFPGQGEFDLPGFLAPIIQSGYTGPLSLEIFNDGFRAAPPRANAADGLRSLLYLEEKTGFPILSG